MLVSVDSHFSLLTMTSCRRVVLGISWILIWSCLAVTAQEDPGKAVVNDVARNEATSLDTSSSDGLQLEEEDLIMVTSTKANSRTTTTEQNSNQLFPATKAPSFVITFNDSVAKPAPNSVTTLPEPPRTSTTPSPPDGSGEVDGSGDVDASGDINEEVVKIDEDNLGNKLPGDDENSSGFEDDLLLNVSTTMITKTTEESESRSSSGKVDFEIVTVTSEQESTVSNVKRSTALPEDDESTPQDEVTTAEATKETLDVSTGAVPLTSQKLDNMSGVSSTASSDESSTSQPPGNQDVTIIAIEEPSTASADGSSLAGTTGSSLGIDEVIPVFNETTRKPNNTTTTTVSPVRTTEEVGSGELGSGLWNTDTMFIPSTKSTSDESDVSTISEPSQTSTVAFWESSAMGEPTEQVEVEITTKQGDAEITTKSIGKTTVARIDAPVDGSGEGSGEGSGDILIELMTTHKNVIFDLSTGGVTEEDLDTPSTTESFVVESTTDIVVSESTTTSSKPSSVGESTTQRTDTETTATTRVEITETVVDGVSSQSSEVTSSKFVDFGETTITSLMISSEDSIVPPDVPDTTDLPKTTTMLRQTTRSHPTETPHSRVTTAAPLPEKTTERTESTTQAPSTTTTTEFPDITFVDEVIGVVTVDSVGGAKPVRSTTMTPSLSTSTVPTTTATTRSLPSSTSGSSSTPSSTIPTTSSTTSADPTTTTAASSSSSIGTSKASQGTTVPVPVTFTTGAPTTIPTSTPAATTTIPTVHTTTMSPTTIPPLMITTQPVPVTTTIITQPPTTISSAITAFAIQTSAPQTSSPSATTFPSPTTTIATFPQTSSPPSTGQTTKSSPKTTTTSSVILSTIGVSTGLEDVVVRGKVRITDGIEWNNGLGDTTSDDYSNLSSQMKTLLADLFAKSSPNSEVLRVENIRFKQGSVIVEFDVVLSPGSTMNTTDISNAFTKALQNPGALGNYTADPSYTAFEVVSPGMSSTTTSPVYVKESTAVETYLFPDWAIGMIIAAGILLIFIFMCSIVLCCSSSIKQDQGNYLVSSQADSSSPNTSKIEIDMGMDSLYSTNTTLERNSPVLKKTPLPPTGVPPPPPIHPMPNGKMNGQARQEEEEADTLARYTPSGPGQADNGVSEVVDLTGIYIVDGEVGQTRDMDEYSTPNGSVHVNGKEQLMCDVFGNGNFRTSSRYEDNHRKLILYDDDDYIRTFYDEVMETWETFM